MAKEKFSDRPKLNLKEIPKDELPDSQHLESLINGIGDYCFTFKCAVKLFEHALQELNKIMDQNFDAQEGVQIRSYWPQAACHDAILQIYHFGKILEELRGSGNKTPTIWKSVNTEKIKLAEKILNANFPAKERSRHAIGHEGEHRGSLEKRERNTPDGKPFMASNVNENTMVMTFEDAVLTVEISEAKVNKLQKIRDLIFEAFDAPKS